MKVVTVVGARPQFVKAAVVLAEFAKRNDIDEVLIHTGQHFDDNMSRMFFEEMNLKKPDYQLDINNLPHGALTGRMMERLETIFADEKPDWVIVFGDTDTTLAAVLSAKKMNLRVAHVEAGLRSFNMQMPEEINRIVTDRISDLLFCPTQNAAQNLLSEGISKDKIVISGDVMKDAMIQFGPKMRKPNISIPKDFILCTFHRAEIVNNSTKLLEMVASLEQLCNLAPIVCPLHPHTRKVLTYNNFDFSNTKISFISPVGYLEMLYLLNNCKLVLTDSGGLQKEAYFAKKICLTLRNETEWTELVNCGYNILTTTNPEQIIKLTKTNFDKIINFNECLYGNGNAASIIVNNIK